MVSDLKQEEMSIFERWKKSQEKKDFQDLYTSMKPVINKAARNASFGSNIPESAFKIYAAQAFYDSLQTYDPTKGTALTTHVTNSVGNKVKRLNYKYQNLGSIPEPRAAKVGLYQNVYSNLYNTLDREPSTIEMADELGWGVRDVTRIQSELSRRDLALSEGVGEQAFIETSKESEILSQIYPLLSPDEQNVYDYVLGTHGKPKLVKPNNKIDFDRIAGRVGYSPSKVRYILSGLAKKLEREFKR